MRQPQKIIIPVVVITVALGWLFTTNSISDETFEESPISNHNTYITFSNSPIAFEEGMLIAEEASVPDLLICYTDSTACKKGDFLVYFVDAQTLTEKNTEQISVIRSTDGGQTWSNRQVVSIEGKPNDEFAAVDPSVIQLEDGSLRLYFAFFDVNSSENQSNEHYILSAISSDGINFEVEKESRISKQNLTDPEVIYSNGLWYMFYSLGQNSGMAISQDGLDFEDKGTLKVNAGGVPGAIAEENNTIRIYGCLSGKIMSAISQDGGNFTIDATSIFTDSTIEAGDPSIQQVDNRFAFVYKVVSQ